MREIKFRGRTPKGEWLYGDLQQWSNGDVYIGTQNDTWTDDGFPHTDDYLSITKVNENTVGQFTGLHDCKGRKIYEGDIIRSYGSKGDAIIHVVSYDEEHAGYIAHLPNGTKYDFGWGHIEQSWVDEFKKEVIGNVFDNPELLKGGKK